METPSSTTRRVTRSQTKANNSNLIFSSKKVDESENTTKKSKQDRCALIDITNDSPIVGLAIGNLKTPSSTAMSKRGRFVRTPGSGEALLRGQVKTLLQKVEEEAEISKITLENRPFFNLVVAPTPANTPQVLNGDACLMPCVDGSFLIPQPQQVISEMVDVKKQEEQSIECDNLITRSLLFDFSDKSDSSECSSVLTYQRALFCGVDSDSSREKLSTDDDDASSVWSIQVNAASSTIDDEEDEEEECDDDYYHCEEEDEEEDYDDFGDDKNDGVMLDELCEGISKISVKDQFTGKHIRFVYNDDDDEIQGEDQVLHLKGLPTPKGKHIRFAQESEDN